jgi:hypothetical protein
MTEQHKASLQEYIEGLQQAGIRLGCIYANTITNELLTEIEVPFVDARSKHPGQTLQEILPYLESGTACLLIIDKDLSGTIRNQLSLIADGSFNAHLPGKEEPVIINPLPQNTLILLTPDNTNLDTLHLQTLCTTACDLTT